MKTKRSRHIFLKRTAYLLATSHRQTLLTNVFYSQKTIREHITVEYAPSTANFCPLSLSNSPPTGPHDKTAYFGKKAARKLLRFESLAELGNLYCTSHRKTGTRWFGQLIVWWIIIKTYLLGEMVVFRCFHFICN